MIEGISLFCFGASYAVAWVLELAQLVWRTKAPRIGSLLFGGAGLLAQTLYLGHQFLFAGGLGPLASPAGSMVFLAWILAIFYFYGSFHHRKLAWGLFVLPLVAGLVALAWLVEAPAYLSGFQGEGVWQTIHGVMLLLAAVGVSVAFVASLMYLVQAHRLRHRVLPGRGLRMFSLERLEEMNRRAIIWAFPLLTAGVLVGAALMVQGDNPLHGLSDPRLLGGTLVWLLFALLLYLRYAAHIQGRRLAFLTIVAFALLLFSLASSHTFVAGVGP